MNKIRTINLCRTLIVFFSCSMVCAGSNLHIGSLEIHPFQSVEQTYNDNIYLEAEYLNNSDQITKSQLGISLRKPARSRDEYVFKARYFADIYQYNNHEKEDRTDHTVDAQADFLFAGQLILKLDERYKKTADPPNSELTNLEKRVRNINGAVIGYKGRLFSFEVNSQYIRDNYENLGFLDKKEYVTSETISVFLSPKTSLFGEYNFGQMRYDLASGIDSDYSQWRGGIKSRISQKITAVIKGGHKATDYNDTRTITEKDFKGGTFFAHITYNAKARTAVELFGDRTTVESTYLTNNYYVRNQGGARIDQKLINRIYITGTGSYQLNAYPEELTDSGFTAKRRDHVRIWTGGLRYELAGWLQISGGYTFSERDSNFNYLDYKNNVYSGKIS
ncbi:MAG: outer membrane beta-barrel protein, partial [bacterium]